MHGFGLGQREDLSERLGADFESRLKMWTNFKRLIVGSVIAMAVA